MITDSPRVVHITADNFGVLAGMDLSYSMLFVRRGTLNYRACGAVHIAEAMNLIFAPSQSSFDILNISVDADVMMAVWSKPFAICAYAGEIILNNIFFAKRMVEPHIPLTAPYSDMVDNYFSNFGRAIDDVGHLFHNIMMFTTFSGLIFLAVFLFNEYDKTHIDVTLRRDRSFRLAEQLTTMMGNELLPPQDVAYYAERLGVSKQYLHRVVSKVFGVPFGYIQDYYRLFYIHQQLLYTNKDLDEIAEEASFSSTSALIRYFNKNLTITPAQYRSLKAYASVCIATPPRNTNT